MTQSKLPSLGVLETMTLFSTPGFMSSILTAAVGLPVDDQVMGWLVPLTQDSPPLGDVTIKDSMITKLELLESVKAELIVLVILIL